MQPSRTLFNIFVNDIPSLFTNSCTPVKLGETNLNCLLYGQYNLRTADRTESKMQTERYKMQTERYKMQTGDKMQTGCE